MWIHTLLVIIGIITLKEERNGKNSIFISNLFQVLLSREPINMGDEELYFLSIDSFHELTKVLVPGILARRATTSFYTRQFKMVTV